MLIKEGNDLLVEVIQTSHAISHSPSVISSNHPAPKKLLECMKQLDVSLMLYNCEFRKHLKSRGHFRMWIDSEEEASFAANESPHPFRLQPFIIWLTENS